jgi:23S rRNA (guanine2445-N2)-methyltransferase / 23S rRNA (guanine2069-N7)-methyltransferase
MRLRADKKYKLFNGPIECELRIAKLKSREQFEESQKRTRSISESQRRHEASKAVVQASKDFEKIQLNDSETMLANRLRKNIKRYKGWTKKEGISAYRVYDADIPEYAAAIDIYEDKLHIQEYRAPKTIKDEDAKKRFEEIVRATKKVFEADDSRIFIKVRERNRGKQQYQKIQESNENDFFTSREGSAKLRVNLNSYLDTGVFLDHRPLRRMIHENVRSLSFLNLYCYTAVASLQAALGGASESVSVDMSNTYLDWAKQNFQLNGIDQNIHKLERADVQEWLKKCRRGFDVIMLDPPSFSNSKKMQASFDVQRDHVDLIKRCAEILKPGGTLFFSNNFRAFKLDEGIKSEFRVEDIKAQSLDPDFQKRPNIHHCWRIQNK